MIKSLFIILTCVCVCGVAQGQINLKAELNETELYNLRTEFEQLAERKEVQQAVEKGVLVSKQFILSGKYKEAGNICMQMDNLIYTYDRQTGKTSFLLRFLVAKERLRMYTRESSFQRSKTQFDLMNYCVRYLEDDSYMDDDVLLVKAQYYHAFGMAEKSLECYEMLLQRCLSGKADQGWEDCFKNMIAYAEQDKNVQLGQVIQKKYMVWQDSIQMVRAAQELETLKKEHETLLTDMKEKEGKISSNQTIIACLWGFIIIMIVVFLVLLFLFLRSIYQIRKLKKGLEMANDSNEQKSTFISSINSQISPSLDKMEYELGHSPAGETLAHLKKNIADMQTYISLEEVLEQAYPMKDADISRFCESVMEKVRPAIKPGVESIVSAPRIMIKTNAEALEHILSYLLSCSAMNTGSGKILLEFKKRNARTGQFLITDTGNSIDPMLQEELFRPFGGSNPIMEGDNWGLPICKLIAYRLNGTLIIDPEYKRGTRFILDFCS